MAYSPNDMPNLLFGMDISATLTGAFQSSAGTTAVATNADPIGYLTPAYGDAAYIWKQATSGNRPTYRTDGGVYILGNQPCVKFQAQHMTLDTPAALENLQDMSFTRYYAFQSQDVTTNAVRSLMTKTTGAGWVMVEDAIWPRTATAGNIGSYPRLQPSPGFNGIEAYKNHFAVMTTEVIVNRFTTGAQHICRQQLYLNGQLVGWHNAIMPAWEPTKKWYMGATDFSSGVFANILTSCWVGAWGLIAGVPTDADRKKLESYYSFRFNCAAGASAVAESPNKLTVICVGDSMTAGPGNDRAWTETIQPMVSPRATIVQVGKGGKTLVTFNTWGSSDFIYTGDLRNPDTTIGVLWLGTNNFGTNIDTAATLYAKVNAYCTAWKNELDSVIVIEPPDRSAGFSGGMTTAAFRAARLAFRALMQASTTADYYVPWNTTTVTIDGVTFDTSLIGAPGAADNLTYFPDNIHPDQTVGYAIVNPVIAAAINHEYKRLQRKRNSGLYVDTDTGAVNLTSGERNSVADALLDKTDGVETGWTLRAVLRLFSAVLLGKTSNGGKTFRDLGDTKNRVSGTVDASNNRTAVTKDAS